MFPLPNVVLFPGAQLPLIVFEPRYRNLIRDVVAADGWLAVPRLRPGFEEDYYGAPAIHEISGAGRVLEHNKLPDGRYTVVVEGQARVRLGEEHSRDGYRVARAARLTEAEPDSATVVALGQELNSLLDRLVPHSATGMAKLRQAVYRASSAAAGADLIASALVEEPDTRQALLEELDPVARMSKLVGLLYDLVSRLQGNDSGGQSLN